MLFSSWYFSSSVFSKRQTDVDVLVCRYYSALRKYTLPLGAWWDQSIFLKSKLGKCLDYNYGMFGEEAHNCSSVNSTSIMACKFLKPGFILISILKMLDKMKFKLIENKLFPHYTIYNALV